jgi:lactoylglutathione lyase
MIKKLATAALYVEDQEKAVEFWTKRAGFEVHREEAMGKAARWIEVGPPGAESCLVIYPKSMMHDWAQRRPSIVFECDDITKTYEEMRGRGVEFTESPKEMAWGPFAIFVDPDGNGFGLRARAK